MCWQQSCLQHDLDPSDSSDGGWLWSLLRPIQGLSGGIIHTCHQLSGSRSGCSDHRRCPPPRPPQWIRDCNEQNGVVLLSSRQELTRLREAELLRYFHLGYPDCREEDRPYQLSSQHVCSEKEWQSMSYWLTGDPTFLKKLEIHCQELRDKTQFSY